MSAIPGPTPRPSPRAETASYAAFISYSHAVDGSLAPALQQALHRFAKPWYRLRALRVFRDESTLAVSPGLWSSIEQALAGSRWFILLASPEAAASPWVQREVGYWCREKSPSTLLIVLTGGTVAWRRDGRDFDWAATTALPRSQLENVFAEEPRYIDLSWARREEHLSLNHPRFRNCVADLAAPLHGRSKDELVGEDVRQHRRTVRLARSVIASLTALTLVVGVLALVARSNAEEANRQRDQARVQRDQAISRQLAVLAAADLGDRPDRALLEGVQARRTSDTAEARGALLSALQRNSRLVALVPAGAPVSDVAFSPAPGRPVLATGDQAGTVALWDPRDSSLLSSMAPDHGPVLSVAFSPDGGRLAAGTQDGTVAIWEVRDPSRPRPLPSIDGSGQLTSVAFSVDGRTVAAASDNHMVMLGRVGQAKVLRWLDDEQGREPLFSVAFSPDGGMLVAGGDDGTVAFWAVGDLPRRKPRLIGTPVQARADAVYSVAFSPDGQVVAVGSSSRTVTLWDVRRRTVVGTSRPDRGDVVDVAFGRRGRTLVSAAAEGVTVWDGSGPLVRSDAFPVHHAVERLAVSPDGRQVAVASSGDDVPARTVAIWSTRARSPLMTPLPRLGRSTRSLAFSPDGRILAAGGSDGTVTLLDAGSGRQLWMRQRQAGDVGSVAFSPDVRSVAFSPNGRILASAGLGGGVVLWSVQDGTTRGPPLPAGPNGAGRVAFSPDGRTLAVAGSSDELGGGAVRLWDVERGTPAGDPLTTQFTGAMVSVAFSPDGRRLASGSADGTVTLWDLSRPAPTGRRLAMAPQAQGAFDLAFSADGRRLAVASGRGIVLWDVPGAAQDGEPLSRRNHEASEVAFPSGKGSGVLASADLNGTVVLWDVSSRSPMGDPLLGHTDGNGKGGVAFRPDGRLLAAGGQDISLWDVDPSSWAAKACRLVRPLAHAASPEFRPDQVPPDVCP